MPIENELAISNDVEKRFNVSTNPDLISVLEQGKPKFSAHQTQKVKIINLEHIGTQLEPGLKVTYDVHLDGKYEGVYTSTLNLTRDHKCVVSIVDREWVDQ
jgi:hypothetical protein